MVGLGKPQIPAIAHKPQVCLGLEHKTSRYNITKGFFGAIPMWAILHSNIKRLKLEN